MHSGEKLKRTIFIKRTVERNVRSIKGERMHCNLYICISALNNCTADFKWYNGVVRQYMQLQHKLSNNCFIVLNFNEFFNYNILNEQFLNFKCAILICLMSLFKWSSEAIYAAPA